MLGTYRVVALDPRRAGGFDQRRHPRRSRATAPRALFKLVVRQGDQVVEEYDRLNTGRGKANVATAVNAASKLIRIEETATGAAVEAPEHRRRASTC